MDNSPDKLCRLCLKLSEDAVELFHYKNGHLIADLVKIICPIVIEINENQILPQKICIDCLELVVDATHLRDISLINDLELRSSILELGVKSERFEDDSAIFVEALDEATLDEDIGGFEFAIPANSVLKEEFKRDYCELCNSSFCNPSSLKRHQLRKHANVHIFCDLCNQTFKTKNEIENHMKKKHIGHNPIIKFLYSEKLKIDLSDMFEKVHESPTFTCSFCSFYEFDEERLNEHMTTTHQKVVDSGKMYCVHCPSKIDTMEFMVEHTKTHNEIVKTHRCLICNKTFPYDEKFLNHLRNHKKNQHKICFCPECGRKFSKPRMMEDHIRFIHKKESLFCCSQCGQGFGSKSALNGHIRRHIEGNKYQCPFCPKTFSSHNLLNSHKVVHSTDRPFGCFQCNKRFKNQKVLNDHLKRHDGGNQPVYICSICNRALNTSYALSRHMLIHSGSKPHQCVFCQKAYAQKNDLNKHMRTHVGENTYFCDFPGCEHSFRILADLRIHEGIHYIAKNSPQKQESS